MDGSLIAGGQHLLCHFVQHGVQRLIHRGCGQRHNLDLVDAVVDLVLHPLGQILEAPYMVAHLSVTGFCSHILCLGIVAALACFRKRLLDVHQISLAVRQKAEPFPQELVVLPQPLQLGGVCTVHAALADVGQHFIKHPALELFRTGQLRVGDEPVQVAFGEKVGLLFAA